jgi:hypothetical protein
MKIWTLIQPGEAPENLKTSAEGKFRLYELRA